MPPPSCGNMHIPPNVSGNSHTMNYNDLIYQSKAPLNFYIGIIGVCLITIIFGLKIPFPEFLIYPGIVFGLWFVTISRYACRIQIYHDKIIVNYLGFWHKNRVIKLENQINLDIRTPLWSFNLNYESEILRNYIFYDALIFEDVYHKFNEVRINVRVGQFDKIARTIYGILASKNIQSFKQNSR